MPLNPGDTLENRYRIQKVIKRGGMGVVYLATDSRFEDHEVAIKENLATLQLKESMGAGPSTEELVNQSTSQFSKEALLLARLRHSSLPRVTDYFALQDRQYLVMDFIHGTDLDEIVSELGAYDVSEAVRIVADTCGILEYLHKQEPPIYHRDIKPSNLRRLPDGRIFLVDFGIAKAGSTATIDAARGVTAGYSPLEQYSGTVHTDARSDIYALGACLFTLLTADRPPAAPERVAKPNLFLEKFTDLPGKVLGIVERAMAVNPDDRYPTARAFHQDLDEFLNGPAAATVVDAPVKSVKLLTVKEAGVASARVAWTRYKDDGFRSYEVHCSTTPGFAPSDGTHRAATLNPFNTDMVVEDLNPGTTYYFRVRVKGDSGQAADSEEMSLLMPVKPPDPVRLREPMEIGSDSLRLEWGRTDAPDFDRYEVHGAQSSGFTETVHTIQGGPITNPATNTLRVERLQPGATYYFRVRVQTQDGRSSTSNEVSALTRKPAGFPVKWVGIGVGAVVVIAGLFWGVSQFLGKDSGSTTGRRPEPVDVNLGGGSDIAQNQSGNQNPGETGGNDGGNTSGMSEGAGGNSESTTPPAENTGGGNTGSSTEQPATNTNPSSTGNTGNQTDAKPPVESTQTKPPATDKPPASGNKPPANTGQQTGGTTSGQNNPPPATGSTSGQEQAHTEPPVSQPPVVQPPATNTKPPVTNPPATEGLPREIRVSQNGGKFRDLVQALSAINEDTGKQEYFVIQLVRGEQYVIGDQGMWMGKNINIEGNGAVIRLNGRKGFVIDQPYTEATVRNVTFVAASSGAVEITQGLLTLENVDISAPSNNGINVKGGNLVARGCTIHDSRAENRRGVLVTGGSGEFQNCNFRNNTVAVGVQSGKLKLTGCEVTGSLGGGVRITGGIATLNDSRIVDNTGDGVFVKGPGAVTITGGAVKSNKRYGLACMEGGTIQESGCDVSKNGESDRAGC